MNNEQYDCELARIAESMGIPATLLAKDHNGMYSVTTNYLKKDEDRVAKLLMQAADNTGWGVSINGRAYDVFGKLMPDYFEAYIHHPTNKDFSDFWQEYWRLENEQEKGDEGV